MLLLGKALEYKTIRHQRARWPWQLGCSISPPLKVFRRPCRANYAMNVLYLTITQYYGHLYILSMTYLTWMKHLNTSFPMLKTPTTRKLPPHPPCCFRVYNIKSGLNWYMEPKTVKKCFF